jgi:ABC-type Fe3+/spermidine/putrescine transport system ATPase subunit
MSEGRIRQLGTPEEIYRRPSDRFVASFIGDANVLRGWLDSMEGTSAIVAVGTARVRVPHGPLAGLTGSAPVDLFVRPEHLAISEATEVCAASGMIITHVYQGGHVDTYIECGDSSRERLLVRSGGHEALSRWPSGSLVGISITSGEAVAFTPVA